MDGGTMQGGTGWPSDRVLNRYRCPECGDVLLELDDYSARLLRAALEIDGLPDELRLRCACGWPDDLREMVS
jgi:hypothetical protein